MTRIYCVQIKLTKKFCNHNPIERLGERWITRDGLRVNNTHSKTRRRCQFQRIQASPRSELQTHSSIQSSLNMEGNRSQNIATGRNIVVAVDASEVCTKSWFRGTVLLIDSFPDRPLTPNHLPLFPSLYTPTGFRLCFQMDGS
jgi:hypothetical protein